MNTGNPLGHLSDRACNYYFRRSMSDIFWNNVFADQEFHYGTEVNAWVSEAVGRYVLNGQWFANLGIDTPDEL
jgi:hypothetical protein